MIHRLPGFSIVTLLIRALYGTTGTCRDIHTVSTGQVFSPMGLLPRYYPLLDEPPSIFERAVDCGEDAHSCESSLPRA